MKLKERLDRCKYLIGMVEYLGYSDWFCPFDEHEINDGLKGSKNKNDYLSRAERKYLSELCRIIERDGEDLTCAKILKFNQDLSADTFKYDPQTWIYWAEKGYLYHNRVCTSRPSLAYKTRDEGYRRAIESWTSEDEKAWDYDRPLIDAEDLEMYDAISRDRWGYDLFI